MFSHLGRIPISGSGTLNQEEYLERYRGLVKRYEAATERISTLEKKRSERMAKADAIGGFMFELMERDPPLEYFDERLWLEVINSVLVHHDGQLTFKFQNGMEVRV